MSHRFSLASLIIVLGAALPLASLADGFKAGIAVRVVTPDPLLPVSGGVGESRPTTQKQGELTVRALVLEDGTNRVAICSTDFLGFPSVLGNRVRALVHGIPGSNILIGATHTHSAPDCYGFPDGKGGTSADFKYLESVCTRLAEAIDEASGTLQPVGLKVATGEAKGKIAYNYYAEQLYDPRCHVLQAILPDGKPLATLVNYAIHPEVIGNSQGICSPDLIGPLCDQVAAAGGGIALFMNSAQGGMVTADNRRPGGEVNDWTECQRIGRLLGTEALRIVHDAPIEKTPRLYCTSRTITFPVDSPLMRQLIQALPPSQGSSTTENAVSTQLNLVNIGDAQILTIPGEALPNIGYFLKRKMRGTHNLLFGLTNDAFGYILTREDFDSFRRYEYVSRTSLGERTAEILEEEALRLVNESPQPDRL